MPRLLTPARVADFRNRLCDVAMQLLAEVGYDGFNMRELASRLGVSAMTAYRYFKDKDEILDTVRTRAFDRLADVLEVASAGPGTPATRCAAVSRAYIHFARQEPIYYRLMFDGPRRPMDPTPEFQRAESRVRSALSQYLRTASVDGSFRGDPELIGRVLWSALHGIVTLRMAEKLTGAESESAPE
jgi:AcrR family transcriptional regulator